MHHLRLYRTLLRLDLLVRSQYRADFLLGLLVAALQHSPLILLWLIYRQVPMLKGWNAYQAITLYSLFSLSMSLPNILAGGLRELPALVLEGAFTDLLVRPASPFVQMVPRINLNGLTDLIVSTIILVFVSGPAGIEWTPVTVIYLLLAVLCGGAIILGLLIAIYSLAFWIPYNSFMNSLEEVIQIARYPMGIYPRWLQVLGGWGLPLIFAANFPAAILTGIDSTPMWMGLLAIPAAAISLLGGGLIWRSGIKRFEGTGT